MKLKILRLPVSSATRRASLLLLSMMFAANSAQAEKQDIVLNPCNNIDISFAAKPNEAVATEIKVSGASGNVEWGFNSIEAGCTSVSATQIQCAQMTVTIPTGSVPATTPVTISGTPTAIGEGRFSLIVGDASNSCVGKYLLRVTSTGGGWGDPHMTTVDGAHYDFQSAGEFTALREDRFELQTRQTAVATTTIPGANPYTGLSTCVSIYTAVAARIGSSRVTLQPNLSGEPDPSGIQLRVNGQLVTVPENGIDLRSGGGMAASGPVEGRIVKVGDSYEITDTRGTQLVVTPAFWDSQQKWYLNVNVYQTTATQGIIGRLAQDSWLPALPDGTSLGGKPDSDKERYQQLYETFADAWRVTGSTSLFDYAQGTNTGTFTLDEWPRFNPDSCGIQGQTSAKPATAEAAAQACNAITDAAQKADCIFDVTVTGHTGFAQSYEAMQRFQPHGTGWQPVLAGSGTGPAPTPEGWPWWWWILLLLLVLIILAVLLARRRTP